MALEIEHKYLVDNALWKNITPQKSAHIAQAYLCIEPKSTIRIRIKDTQAFLTIKSKSIEDTRDEFEYEIPLGDAIELYNNFCESRVLKNRYVIEHSGFTWEVDEFMDQNLGLITAEIELKDESVQLINIPDWILEDVTHDDKYKNSNLAK